MKSLRTIATLALLAIAPAAQAHPGHNLQDASTLHLITSPYHLAVLALMGTALLLAGRFIQRRLPRRVVQGLGVMALFAAALLWHRR